MAFVLLKNNMPHSNTLIPGRVLKGAIEPSGSLWPNGEFTVSYAVAPGLEEAEADYLSGSDGALPLGSSIVPICHSEADDGKPKKGTGGLTSHGKKVLRNSIARMQRLHGKNRIAFVTLTLPAVSFDQSWLVSSDWSRVVRVFFQKLGRYFERLELPTEYAACTEVQTERMDVDGHPSLHLHFICVTKRRGEKGWAITPGEFRWIWASVIGPMCPDIEFWGAVENVVRVKKDVGAYMAKYLSKGSCGGDVPRSDETGWSLPTSWYSVRFSLRQWVLDHVRRHPRLMEYLEKLCVNGDMAQFCHYFYPGCVEEMAGPGPHYFVGKLKGEDMEDLMAVWRCEVLDVVPLV